MAQEREWSHYQQAVFRAVEETGDHLIVEAVAGGAKSTTIVEATRRFVGRYKAKVVFLAFNKHIAAELKGKLGSGVQARTMHSLGYSMLRRDLPQEPEVDEDKVQKILEEMIPLPPKEKQRHDPGLKARAAMLRSIHNAVARLVSMMKNVLAKPDLDGVAYVHEHYNLELDVPEGLHLDPAQTAGNKFDHLPQFQRDAALRQLAWWEYLAPKCREVMDRCLNPDSLGTIDYDDMIWLPVMLREVVFPKFDLVAVDECFVGDTPVLLPDHSTRPIRELVEQRYDGDVLSFQDGKTVAKRVIGWKRIPAGKPMVRVTIRRCGYSAAGKRFSPLTEYIRFGNRLLVCTEDHRIYSNGEWVEAAKLVPGQRVIVESHHPRVSSYTARYKIGAAGKQRLAADMSAKNSVDGFRSNARQGRIVSRGGNGKGPSDSEAALLERLGDGWVWSYVVPTGQRVKGGLPSHYKIDIAHPEYQIAIELDGVAHQTRRVKDADARKSAFLEGKGWRVIRLTNAEAAQLSDEMLHELIGNSPVEGEVLSVEPYAMTEPWVYDLTVADTHCYYADGVLVHNCQDMNLCQHRFIERLVRRGARMVLVGDSNQSIYAWRGARTDSMARLKTKLVATQLPLSVSYRCPLKHVALAKQFVPHIEPAPNAIPGRLEARWLEDILRESHTGDLIISRANAPLIGAAYQLIRMGKKAMVRGREIGVGIRTLLEQLKATDIYDLQQKIDKWEIRESRPLMDDPKGLARVHDKAETLRVLSTKADNVAGVFKAIDEIFSDKISGICCSSVHRSKGLEADRVVILQPWRMPMVRERMKAWEYQEEINVLYVAITRSKHDLVLEINEASSSGFLPSWLLPGMLDMNDVDGSTDGGSPIVRRRREQEREVSEFQNSPDAMIARLREQAASQSPQPNSGAELYSEAGAPEIDRLLATAPDNDDPEAPHRA